MSTSGSHTTPPRAASAQGSAARRSRNAEGRGSTLIPLGILVLGLLELTGLALLGHWTSIWWVLGVVLVGWVVGLALLVAVGQQSFVRLRSLIRAVRGRGSISDHLSRPAFTLLAALCFFFPGILTDLAGLVLLIVPVQKRVARGVGLSVPESARQVLYRRSGPGVIEGEIVVDAQRNDPGAYGRGGTGSGPSSTPPVITQD